MQATGTLKLYPRLLRYIYPYKGAIALTLLALFGMAALEPFIATTFQKLVDESLIAQDPDAFLSVPLMLAGIFVLKGALEYCSKVSSQWIAQQATLEIRSEMFAKLHRLPLSAHHEYGTGRMMSKITYDVPNASSALSNAWVVVIRDTLTILALLAYLLYVSWQLTLILGVAAPVMAFLIDRASRMMRRFSKAMQANMGDLTGQLDEGIRGHKDIKIYGTEDFENQQFRQTAEQLRKNTMKVTRVSALNVPLVQVLAAIALAFIVYTATLMSADGQFTPGELLAYITAMALIFEPVRRITNINQVIQKGMAGAESIFELLDRAEETNTGSTILANNDIEIRFEEVSFAYPNSEHPALVSLDLVIPTKQTTAFVGQSGSGKTTIVNLLARFYEIDSGKLLFNNTPFNELELVALRQKMAFVSQHIVLLNDTVAANIAYGHENYDIASIERAAKQAHAWEFIEKLPQGLETNIGDNGSALSGGQRQRIALARAFLKRAPILVLDEATSALDNQSEKEIQAAMEEMRGQATIIVIAHRLSTIESADNIVVLDQGRLVEQGNHQSLLAKKGVYFDLQNRYTG